MANQSGTPAYAVCDFCNTKSVSSVYPTKPFYFTTDRHIFADAPITSIDGLPCVSTEELHPVHGTAQYFEAGWTACESCATLIDAHDHTGLVQRCYGLHYGMASTDTTVFELYHLLYLAFFKHQNGPRVPYPALG